MRRDATWRVNQQDKGKDEMMGVQEHSNWRIPNSDYRRGTQNNHMVERQSGQRRRVDETNDTRAVRKRREHFLQIL